MIEKRDKISITSAFTLEVPEIVYKYIPEYLVFWELTSLDKKGIFVRNWCGGSLSAPVLPFYPLLCGSANCIFLTPLL